MSFGLYQLCVNSPDIQHVPNIHTKQSGAVCTESVLAVFFPPRFVFDASATDGQFQVAVDIRIKVIVSIVTLC